MRGRRRAGVRSGRARARLLPGTAVVADVVGLDARIDTADLAVVVVDSSTPRRCTRAPCPRWLAAPRRGDTGRGPGPRDPRGPARAGGRGDQRGLRAGVGPPAAAARVARVARTWTGGRGVGS
ncbi:hypothetical protein NKG05_26440 [Oerskovia sp. M15]